LFHDLPLSKYLQKRQGYVKKEKRGKTAQNTCFKKKRGKEIAHVSNISKRRAEEIMQKGVS
jgi:hypothetical protein